MTKHLYIITGASRGLGFALSQQLLHADHSLLCISRTENTELANLAKTSGCTTEQWPLNLDHGQQAAARLAQWLGRQGGLANQFLSATLINNAALLPSIAPLSATNPAEIATVLRVGLEAPMQLAAAFLNATESWQAPNRSGLLRRVLNISSGLGRRPMASQALYCATKAGLDHFTRCLALEEAAKPHGAKVCSIAPGVIDTDMQVHLRSAQADKFADRGRFLDLKAQGHLSSPQDCARKLLTYLHRADFGSNPIADVNEAG
jgi:benzil reductase ((S)-benzoin forming)